MMHRKTERIAVIISLLVLHLGVALKLSGVLPAGIFLLLAGVIMLSLVYAVKGFRLFRKYKDSQKTVAKGIIIHHLNLFVTLYTIMFLFLDSKAMFLKLAIVSLILALFTYILHHRTKTLLSRSEIIKSAVLNAVVIIGLAATAFTCDFSF